MRIIFFITCLFCISQNAVGCELSVRFERFSVDSKNAHLPRWHGLDADFAKLLLDSAECRYQFMDLPWARAMDSLKAGALGLMLSVSKTTEREQYFYFIGPQRIETIVLAMDKDNVYDIKQLSDLVNLPKPIAVHRTAYYGDAFQALLDNHPEHFITVVDNAVKLELLARNKISGFLEEKGNLIYQHQMNPKFAHIYIDDFVINSDPVYFAFSRKALSQIQLDKIKRVFQSSDYQNAHLRLLQKYGLE